jgi:hypothetical protein
VAISWFSSASSFVLLISARPILDSCTELLQPYKCLIPEYVC